MTNPYITKLIALLGEVKGWGLALIAGVTVAVIVIDCIRYQQGSSQEKADAKDSIKKHLYMGGATYALVWLATYVITKMK